MARGWPAFWTTLIALPFLLGGSYVYLYMPEYPTSTGTVPILFAVFMILLGLYVHVLVAPEPPAMQPGEKLHIAVSPFSWASIRPFSFFLTFFVVTVYLRFNTDLPVLLPAAAMVVTLYFLVTGLVRYWKSSLTVHYVTSRRIITDYRFLWVIRVEVPLPKITGLEQRKTVLESLMGIGNVVLVTGAGGRRPARIEMHDIRNAMQVRKTIAALRVAHAGEVDDPEDLDDSSLLDPIVDVSSDRVKDAIPEMLGRDDEDEAGDAGDGSDETTVDRSRAYTVDADLNISLAPDIGGGGDDESNSGAASKLLGVAASQALNLGSMAGSSTPIGLVAQLVNGSRNGAAISSLLEEALDEVEGEGDLSGRTERTIKEKIKS